VADNAMGLSARIVAQAARPADGERHAGALTVSLSIDFVDIARPGDWLEVLPTVVRAGKTLSFVESRIVVGDRTIARANATFRMA
jgi:acyl-coenzyme A thioesterase PaaI-like protein